MTLLDEMKKLNNFGQRDDPPSYSIISKINTKLDDLIFDVNIKMRSHLTKSPKFDEIVNELHYILNRTSKLQSQLTLEFSALWGEIDRLEKVELELRKKQMRE